MRDAADSPKRLSTIVRKCLEDVRTHAPMLVVGFAAAWGLLTYMDNEFDQVVERQDRLHTEMRAFTEKMIRVHVGEVSQQIADIRQDISTAQELFLTQANAMMAQVERTATNKVGLETIKEELAEEKTDKQALKNDVNALNDNVREIWAHLGSNGASDPAGIEPAAGSSGHIRPAFKPLE